MNIITLIMMLLVGFETFVVTNIYDQKPVALVFEGRPMTNYGAVVTGLDGQPYRVGVTDVEEMGVPIRVSDAYSLTGKYAEIVTVGELTKRPTRSYACTKAQMVAERDQCRGTDEVRAFMADLVKKTVRRENNHTTFEIMWSWDTGTKDLIEEIKSGK